MQHREWNPKAFFKSKPRYNLFRPKCCSICIIPQMAHLSIPALK